MAVKRDSPPFSWVLIPVPVPMPCLSMSGHLHFWPDLCLFSIMTLNFFIPLFEGEGDFI